MFLLLPIIMVMFIKHYKYMYICTLNGPFSSLFICVIKEEQ